MKIKCYTLYEVLYTLLCMFTRRDTGVCTHTFFFFKDQLKFIIVQSLELILQVSLIRNETKAKPLM